jgi:hypothetical protein
MYRIIFNPKTAKWEIHLSFMVIFWRRVTGEEFDNFGDAQKRCYELGLDQVYKCWNDRPSLMAGSDQHGGYQPRPMHHITPPPPPYHPAVLRARQIVEEDRGHGHNL